MHWIKTIAINQPAIVSIQLNRIDCLKTYPRPCQGFRRSPSHRPMLTRSTEAGRGRADRRPISRSLKKSCTRLQGSRRDANIPPAHILGAEYHHQPLRVTSPQQHQSMTIPDRRNHHSLTVSSHNHQPMRVRTARPGPNHERQGHGRCPAPDLERACDVGDAGGRRPRARVRLLGR